MYSKSSSTREATTPSEGATRASYWAANSPEAVGDHAADPLRPDVVVRRQHRTGEAMPAGFGGREFHGAPAAMNSSKAA